MTHHLTKEQRLELENIKLKMNNLEIQLTHFRKGFEELSKSIIGDKSLEEIEGIDLEKGIINFKEADHASHSGKSANSTTK